MEYMETFWKILKPGGLWINFGPLLYHWEKGTPHMDERYGQSVELSLDEVMECAKSYGFEILVRRGVLLLSLLLLLSLWSWVLVLARTCVCVLYVLAFYHNGN
jgi:hypothetical protein